MDKEVILKPELSLFLPVLDEAENLRPMHQRISAALDASQIEPAAFDIRVEDGERPYQLKLRIATSPAARDAQIAAARALISGDGAVLTDVAERATWAAQLDTMSEGDATVRFGWLPARLPPVLTLLEEMRSVDGVGVTFTGRVLGAGVARLTGEVAALAAAIGRLRGSADVGNVVLLRGSHDLKERVDVWGPGQASDRVARAVKKTLDPMGILNAGRGPI